MNTFIELPINNKSIGQRKLVYGVGINDANYVVTAVLNGKQIRCTYYSTWKNMLERCYSEKYHISHPTYRSCFVCKEWQVFSIFRAWMIQQDWNDKQLDKYILC